MLQVHIHIRVTLKRKFCWEIGADAKKDVYVSLQLQATWRKWKNATYLIQKKRKYRIH